MDRAPFGVGLIAAGPVSQAIHLPTLARMPDRFEVVHVVDVDAAVAQRVAARVGARASTDAADLIADPSVEVVVIGTPNRFHAEQVIAACRAGKRAVLCEKPLAVSAEEGDAILAASRASGVPVIVGTMHAFDEGWVRGSAAWEEQGESAHSVRISCVIPSNPWSEDFATEMTGRPAPRPADPPRVEEDVASVVGGVLGLAIHDLPLARRILPDAAPEVLSVTMLSPWGYEIVARVGGAVLEVHGVGGAQWDPAWSLTATGPGATLEVEFPLSYVQAGSATARLRSAGEAQSFGPYADSGYVAEWDAVHDVLTGSAPPPDLTDLVADLDFALDIADQAARLVREAAA